MKRREFITVAGAGGSWVLPSLLFPGCAGKPDKTSGGIENKNSRSSAVADGQGYLFLDDHWLAAQSGVSRHFHAAMKEAGNPVITRQAGEKGIGPYVFGWAEQQSPFTAWLTTFVTKSNEYPLFFVTSPDGMNWNSRRQTTDIFEIKGGNQQCAVYLYDESGKYGDYRYLCAVGFRHTPDMKRFHWRFGRSRDGIRWELFPENRIWVGPSDVMSLMWDRLKKKYVAYYKVWRYAGTTLDGKPFVTYGDFEMEINGHVCHLFGHALFPKREEVDVKLEYGGDTSDDGGGGRSDAKLRMTREMAYAESDDFLHWENEQMVVDTPLDAPLGDQGYGMNVICFDNMYIGLYNHFNSINGLMQPKIVWSYDGIHFQMNKEDFFLTPGTSREWDAGMVIPSCPIATSDGRICLYYGSQGVDHTIVDIDKLHGAIGRAWLRQDGFASLKGGWVETVPLKVLRKEMEMNMTGVVGVTLKTLSGTVIGEAVLRGDHYRLVPDIDLSACLNQEVVVRLDLSNGELFSIRL
jgi:hypothetical protein